ncbi:5-methyltetrahydropteroyltriglutamate--homocysteine S-methyltransferase [Roseomonas aerophila]|uniref:5-methyltetrahydropteroyltriglutamate--homocysteine methyltransferase n=1 Tax=Teichococcus aerophilus TaxID=1224513 RepID=A0ABR7RLY8_9PROT|nr:5-methyltetrahydropteroyltriglutamate--homocysteine S-methyltransferase [Pseudoroseomonas aerophila]MBC9207606.1 5-methyltetrahydropteroyltriglutamate--homocysteine S-methyltransferase [Pseudoroseomonas aerophila]
MSIAANLGFPRIGRRRELKAALEAFWAGQSDEAVLLARAAALRGGHQALQGACGIGHIPSHDAPLYDHVLDHATMLGAIPAGYGWRGEGPVSLATSFALARGARGSEPERARGIAADAPALEMTKWFDTNYHYLVPRLDADTRFVLTENRPLALYAEALADGRRTRPVLLGPVTFLLLSKTVDGSQALALLPRLLPVYAEILRGLAAAGCAWVQVDEPVLATDLPPGAADALRLAWRSMAGAAPGLNLLLASYFGPLGDNLELALSLPSAGLHLDLVRGAADLPAVLAAGLPRDRWLSCGVVDGRNVWRTDLRGAFRTLESVAQARGGAGRLMVSPSCSLLHVPVDVGQEDGLDPALKRSLAFAVQKLAEVRALTLGLEQGEGAIADALGASDAARAARKSDSRVSDPAVAARLAAVAPEMLQRGAPYARRATAQAARLALPVFPTTSIGSWPQTAEIRQARAAHGRGTLDDAGYDAFLLAETEAAIRWQEEAGVDVLVHGEFERNDMVKYFGEQLAGYAFTRHGWVQSYGSRCVAPPIIWGDVSRPAPMTLAWWQRAQALTARPVKGMLTGPVTMLHWSFVRDDLPRDVVCRQIALALRDEVAELEAAGCAIIQIDEPAFREGLPLRRAEQTNYLRWAVECFRLSASAVADGTQIHTHMCYAEFNDIIGAIAAMDADAISIETARSRMELLEAFESFDYPNAIGPGVWDIHSPRVPDSAEMTALLRRAAARIPAERLWVNPDCGCKTRGWAEVRPAMAHVVAAARQLRAELV